MAENNIEKYGFMTEDAGSRGGVQTIQRGNRKSSWIVLACIVSIVALFAIGFFVGYFARRLHSKSCDLETKIAEQKSDFGEFHAMFKESISAEKLEDLMR